MTGTISGAAWDACYEAYNLSCYESDSYNEEYALTGPSVWPMCSPEFAQSLVREGMLLAWYQDLLDFTATGYGIFNFPNHLSASSPPPEFDWSNLQGSSIRVFNNYSKEDETCDAMVNS